MEFHEECNHVPAAIQKMITDLDAGAAAVKELELVRQILRDIQKQRGKPSFNWPAELLERIEVALSFEPTTENEEP